VTDTFSHRDFAISAAIVSSISKGLWLDAALQDYLAQIETTYEVFAGNRRDAEVSTIRKAFWRASRQAGARIGELVYVSGRERYSIEWHLKSRNHETTVLYFACHRIAEESIKRVLRRLEVQH